jgi:hypothetical protein
MENTSQAAIPMDAGGLSCIEGACGFSAPADEVEMAARVVAVVCLWSCHRCRRRARASGCALYQAGERGHHHRGKEGKRRVTILAGVAVLPTACLPGCSMLPYGPQVQAIADQAAIAAVKDRKDFNDKILILSLAAVCDNSIGAVKCRVRVRSSRRSDYSGRSIKAAFGDPGSGLIAI